MKVQLSVLMPVYNGEKYLKECLNSILSQSFSKFELIIIDDGSNDLTSQILNLTDDKRIQVYRNVKNLGVARSLNFGLKKCTGRYIARCDADDIYQKNRFKEQIKFMINNPGVVLVGSDAYLIDQNLKLVGIKEYPKTDKEIRKKIFFKNVILHPSVIMKSRSIRSVGGYREIFDGVEDYDLFFRLLRTGKFYNLKKKLIKRRIHKFAVTKRRHWIIELKAIILRFMNIDFFFKNI